MDNRVDLVLDLVQTCFVKAVNVHEAKTHLSRLLARVEAGEEIVISRGGRPVARLVPVTSLPLPRTLGMDRGRVQVAEDFDAPLPETFLSSFER
jgi:prevent-host-death family protein